MHLDVTPGTLTERIPAAPDAPFRILVLGNFSGRNLGGPWKLDADEVDHVMTDMDISLDLPDATLRFAELDDFHPDRIFKQLGPRRMQATAPASGMSDRDLGRSLLDDILSGGQLVTPAEAAARAPDAGDQLRGILHDPRFQALEAAWRAVWFLVRRLQPDTEVKVSLFDTDLAELPDAEALARRASWSLIIGDFGFGQSAGDAGRLLALAGFAERLGAPFLAEGLPPGAADPDPAWAALRRSPAAAWIGLAVPRFLLRLPYGRETSPIESFPFEEMPESAHEHYLWGNPAFCCALILGEAHRNGGAENRRVDGLPVHVYTENGESVAKPCAEVLLAESDIDFLLEQGFMPLASIRESDSVVLVRFQSIADPPGNLAGR